MRRAQLTGIHEALTVRHMPVVIDGVSGKPASHNIPDTSVVDLGHSLNCHLSCLLGLCLALRVIEVQSGQTGEEMDCLRRRREFRRAAESTVSWVIDPLETFVDLGCQLRDVEFGRAFRHLRKILRITNQ